MKARKKILFTAPLPPPIHGASLRNKSFVESKLINLTFDLIVVPVYFASDNTELGKFSFGKIFKSIQLFFEIIRNTLKFNPDLVYVNMATFGFALYRDSITILLAKLLRRKVVIHIRSGRINEQAENSLFKKKMFQMVFNKTSIICLSNNLSKDVQKVYREQVFIVNDGIALLDPLNHLSRKSGLNSINFLFLSNLLKTKGVYDLINASAALRKINNNFEVWIVGKDAELTTDQVQTYVDQLSLGDNVKVFNAAYGERKVQYYLDSDVFVLPTHFEAFPGVVLEAMQLGLPIISTMEGAIPEIVDHMKNGLIVEKGNIDQLTDAMAHFINSKKMIKLFGENSKKKFISNYTLPKVENDMKDTLETILT